MGFVSIQVVGKKEGIEQFINHLHNIYDNPGTQRFFPRTFPSRDKDEEFHFIEKVEGKEIYDFHTIMECAWSAEGCLLRKGWVKSEELLSQVIDLQELTKTYNLAVELFLEEGGAGFQEHIICIFGEEVLVSSVNYVEHYNEETEEYETEGGYEWDFNDLTVFFTAEGNPINKEEMAEKIDYLESIEL